MDKLCKIRLEARREVLNAATEATKKAMEVSSEHGITRSELVSVHMTLKAAIASFDREVNYITEKAKPSEEELKEALLTLTEAEGLDIQIETMLKINKVGESKTSVCTTKLPKMEMPRYNGDPIKFTQFWDKFEASVHNKDIPETDKLSYLFGCLEGEAAKCLDGYAVSNANYALAIQKLKERFGRIELVIDSHYRALAQLSPAEHSAADCRSKLDIIETHLRVLATLGENTENNQLRFSIKSKFPDAVMYQVNLRIEKDQSVTKIREALETVVTAMELSLNKPEVTNKDPVAGPSSTTEALHVRTQDKSCKKRKIETMPSREVKKPKKNQITCAFCEGSHYPDQCKRYTTVNKRKSCLKRKCFRCFGSGHVAKTCKQKKPCFHCKDKEHNRALCPSKFGYTKSPENTSQGKEDKIPSAVEVTQAHSNINRVPFLQTAVAKINNKSCRLLLDCGSQRSYITCRMAKTLGLRTDGEDTLHIYTFGSNVPNEISSPSAEITICTKRSVVRKVRVNIVPHITDRVPVASISDVAAIDFLGDDDSVGETVDILIGNDFYFSFIGNERVMVQEHLYVVNSDFGWLISGHIVDENENENALSVVTYCQCHQPGCPCFTEPDLPLRQIDMRFLWTLESIGITDSPKSTRQEEAVKLFNESTIFMDGRYLVKWPWVQFPPELPTNYGIAYGRLKGLLKTSDAKTLTEYNAILQEQLDAGMIEVVEPMTNPMCQTEPPVHYLPHHMVKQTGKRGRLVYDASAKLKNEKSLNECMYGGPSMLEDLTGLLLKFRMGKIGITADVEKAFLQVALQQEDRDVTRFLWVSDVSKELTDENLIHLRFTRVPFGVIASPFLLTATIRLHMARTDKTLLTRLADKCYVDNLVVAVNNAEEASELYEQARKVFGEISMNIRDWTSNSKELLQKIPDDQCAKQTDTAKVLGLIWNLEQDSLQLNVNKLPDIKSDDVVFTKKDVLRTLARLYDPCGFASPAILEAKLIFQELCVRKLKWDSPLPEDMHQRWESAVGNLKSTENVRLPRFVGRSMPDTSVTLELHCFCDASKNAYAAVVYLRLISTQRISTAFLMSKARITPIEDKNDLKIPKLELLAYLIGNRLLKYVKANLDVTVSRYVLWTDSQIVLAWMKSSKLLPPFVQRRVNEIKQNKDLELRYVSTMENPADVATRPERWNESQKIWFDGPRFLTKKESCWPSIKKVDADQALCSAVEGLDTVDGPEMTSKGYEEDWEDVMVLDEDTPTLDFRVPVGDENSNKDHMKEIKRLQLEHFPEEIAGQLTSLSKNLGVFLDVDGLLRCKGRMANANWPYDMKHPILIPKDCKFTSDSIRKVHEENYHVGVSQTLSLLRETYWLPQGRTQVQKVLKKCPQCIKHGGGPYKLPETPALPAERVNYSSPFTYVGIDYMGPLYVKSDAGKEKRWICLFTCLAIRAVHLELVKDLTAEECHLALRRCIAARGLPKKIVSDNALYFKLVSEVVSKAHCKENSIQWKFIPQLAPWHGGVYERLVGLIKHCLKRTVEKHLLNDNQLSTVMKEIEAVINSRPLTCVGAELEHVLKPSDFLALRDCLVSVPAEETTGTETSTKLDLLSSWRKGNIVLNEFKRMFSSQYLTSLRERYNSSYKQPRVKSSLCPKVGDVVQIKEDSKNRGNWKVGRISSLLEGADGQCRVAKVKVGNLELTRSIGHLYPLEADVIDKEPKDTTADTTPSSLQSDPILDVSSAQEMEVDPQSLPTPHLSSEPQRSVESALDMEVEVEPVGDQQSSPSRSKSDQPETSDEMEVEVEPVDLQQSSPSRSMSDQPETSGNEVEEAQEPRTSRRAAAIRAREKIAEWTRQLVVLL